jgi:hypothetical protein
MMHPDGKHFPGQDGKPVDSSEATGLLIFGGLSDYNIAMPGLTVRIISLPLFLLEKAK